MSQHDNRFQTIRPTGDAMGPQAQAASCVAFLESMRGRFVSMMRVPCVGVAEKINRAWSTEEERAQVVAWGREGLSIAEIVARLRRSDQWVRTVLRDAGVVWLRKKKSGGGRKRDAEMDARALDLMFNKGLSAMATARLLGRSDEWARNLRARAERASA